MTFRPKFFESEFSPKRVLWLLVLIFFIILLTPAARSYFFEISKRWLYILCFSGSLSFVLTPVMARIARRLELLDYPDKRKIHDGSTPLLGGVAIIIAFSAALLSNFILEKNILLVLVCGFIIAMTGLVDDWKGFPARWKLLIQVLVVGLLIYNGIILDLFPVKTAWSYFLNVIFTGIWIVGITNAMNFIDGMDGLAGGVSAIIAFFLGVIAFQTKQPLMGWIAIAVLGSCIGFLPFNFRIIKPASIFLGDTGSTFLGFVLATLAIIGYWDENPVVSFSVPVLIFWVLIFDMSYITVERIMTGKVRSVREWLDYVGKDHIHHRLYQVLGDKRKAVLFIYFLSATLGISAIALRNARAIDGILLVCQALLITLVVSILEYSGRKR